MLDSSYRFLVPSIVSQVHKEVAQRICIERWLFQTMLERATFQSISHISHEKTKHLFAGRPIKTRVRGNIRTIIRDCNNLMWLQDKLVKILIDLFSIDIH